MKRRDKKFISMITAVVLSVSMMFDYNVISAKGGEISQQDLKELLKEKMEDYAENNSAYSKSNSYKKDLLDENGSNAKDPEEEIRVIVQLNDAPAIEGENGADYTRSVKEDEKNIKDSQSDVISAAEEITGTQVRRSFGYLVNGFSISTKRKNIDELSKIDGVKCVTEVRSYTPSMQYAKEITGAANVWQDLGYKGEGMVVSIIDTGIDYTHKDLQNIDTSNTKLKDDFVENEINKLGYGKHFTDKVPYGYNYADNNTNVIDTGSMHGMHVAGIVAANGDDSEAGTFQSIKGVAPEAQLLAMKVFTNNPETRSAYDDDIIAAIEDSVKLGADVINMSLGSTAGFSDPDDPENQAVQRATDAGVICVISAGNEGTSTESSSSSQPSNYFGTKDTSTVGSPSTASSSLSVASMENTNLICPSLKYETNGGVSKEIEYDSPAKDYLNKLNSKYEIVDCNLGKEADFDGKDLTGKIALIQRGDNTFQEKYDNAVSKNAEGVIIYNHTSGGDVPMGMSVSNVDKPLISVGHKQGEEIKNLINSQDNIFEIHIGNTNASIENPDVGDMSQYTSWGATSDLEFKPEITAPGGDIYSLANNNSYQVMSGTSMAAPNTSGSEALIMQAVKKRYPNLSGADLVKYVKNTAMNTAKPMIDKYDSTNSIPYSPRRQGAGLIQIEKAAENNVIIEYKDGKGAAALKEVGKNTSFQLTLTNYGDKDATYKLKDEKVYGENTDAHGLIHEVVLDGSKATFDKDSVTVGAGESVTVNVTLNISDSEEIDRFVEGYLNFESTDASIPSLSVPFMGFYGDWSKENIVDTPNYEGSDSIVGTTGLVSKSQKLYGSYVKDGQEYVDSKKVAISPNGDKVKDEAIPALYLLRNAKELKAQVLDSDGKVIRELYNTNNVRKNTLEDGLAATYFGGASWDGTVYDVSSGKYVKVEDGQYTVRVTSKVELENAKEQTLDLPVKIDTEAPSAKIKGVEKYTDADGHSHFKLSWEAKDNENGSDIAPIYEVAVNGQAVNINTSDVTEVNGVYSVDIPFVDNEVNNITLAVTDNAGNITTTESREKASNLKTIAVSGLSDGMVIGEKDLKDGKFIVKGTAGDDLGKLQINGKDVEVKDNYFEEPVEVNDGENTIKVYAEDKDGNVKLNNTYKVVLDRKNPEVEIDKNLTDKEPYFTTEDKNLTLGITVKDDTKCTVSIKSALNKADVSLDNNNKGTETIELINGLNKIEVTVEDEAGNKTTKKYLVMKGDSSASLDVEMDNLSVAQYLNKKDTKDGVYTIKGHANKKTGTVKINDDTVNINDDLTFSYDFKLVEGRNMVKLYAEDTDGTVQADYSYKIYYDETAPSVTFDNLVMRGDNKAYVNNADFNLSGVLKENLYGYALYINGEKVLSGETDAYLRENGVEKTFSKNIKLQPGDNIIKIEASDYNGNTLDEDLAVVLDTDKPSKPEIKLSNDKLTNEPVEVTIDSDENQLDRIEYSTDGVNYVEYTGRFTVSSSTKVYARAVDYAGNVSELETADVNIDTTKPEVTLNGVIDGQTYYEPVTLTTDVDDENAKVTVLVNGKEYDGKALDVEGDYTVEAYAVDEAGNESDRVKKSFKLSQNCTESKDGDTYVLKHNDIKPSGDNYLFDTLSSDNLKLSITDPEKGAVITSPNTKVAIPNSIVSAYIKDKIDYTQKIYEDNDLLSSLNSIGKVFEITLNNGKDIKNFDKDKVSVTLKLSEEDLKGKDTSKLKAYVYDDSKKEWVSLDGTFNNTDSTFTFETNKTGKFTVGHEVEEDGADIGNTGVDSSKDNGSASGKNNAKSGKTSFGAKTGDNIVVATAAAAMAVLAAAAAFITRRKKERE